MNPQIPFWITLAVLLFIVIYFDKKYSMLRDSAEQAIPSHTAMHGCS